jgi:LytR cell envelope-related transcriptional attenuator
MPLPVTTIAALALTTHKLVDRVGPILGIVAFVGLAILAFLIFQDAREVRRLREWAGRAPERAAEAIEAQLATAEAREQAAAGPSPGWRERQLARLRGARDALARRLGPAWRELDRRSPIDPRILLIVLVVAVAAAGVITKGFGLVGGGAAAHRGSDQAARPSSVRVAVLNGTQENGASAVPNLASRVADELVKPAGYRAGPITNAPGAFSTSVIMFGRNEAATARALATTVKPKLGRTPVQPMTSSTRAVAGKAQLALVIGLDDSGFGG